MKAFYFLAILVIATSCNSVKRTQRFLTSGNYDEAISLAVKKLGKDKTANEYDAHIQILEEAYEKANQRDLKYINLLKKNPNVQNTKAVYYTYLDLFAREDKIKPLLPLYSLQLGRNAKFNFADYTYEISQARQEYVKALYEEAKIYLDRNTKMDYRSAYNVLCELEEVQINYKDVHQLKNDAHFKGSDFVLVTLSNSTNQLIPYRLERELLDFSTYELDDFWTEYHSQRERGINYTYAVDLSFEKFLISPERILEKQYDRKQRVSAGFEYKRDRRGHIIKDSLGNSIKIEKFKNVAATVITTTQEKSAMVQGRVTFINLQSGRRINSFPLATEFVFSNMFATYRGDDLALTHEDRQLIRNRFIPFPTNEEMVYDAGTDIKIRFKQILSENPLPLL